MLEKNERVTRSMNEIAQQSGISFMLVGAVARDEYFSKVGSETPTCRKTFDVDFACRVSSWSEYESLTLALVKTGEFSPDPHCKHRFIHESTGVPVDLIPFGPIERPEGQVAWPPDYELELGVRGFSEAYECASELALVGTDIRRVPPEWFAMLKLNAWMESPSRTKDVEDFHVVAANYLTLTGDERLWADEFADNDLCQTEGFDYDLAGVRLLGRDCARADTRFAQELIGRLSSASVTTDLIAQLTRLPDMYAVKPEDFVHAFKAGVMDIGRAIPNLSRPIRREGPQQDYGIEY